MGEEAEYMLERMLEVDFHIEYDDMVSSKELQWRFEADIWTTRDGRTHRLKEMSDRHLLNSIKYIESRGDDCVYGYGAPWLPKLKSELKHRTRFGIKLPD